MRRKIRSHKALRFPVGNPCRRATMAMSNDSERQRSNRMSAEERVAGDLHRTLRLILSLTADAIAAEVRYCNELAARFPGIGDVHPALCREAQVECVLFMAYRANKIFTLSQTTYY